MGLKNKRRRAQIAYRQNKKLKQSKKDNIDDFEPRNIVSSSESDNDSDDYFKEKDEFANDVEEVLPITNDSESDTNDDEDDDNIQEENEASDHESVASEDEAPTEAWGKKKRTFFSTDFVDEDRGKSYREEDLENAKAEENDALAMHRNFLSDIYSSKFNIASENEFLSSNVTEPDHLEFAHPDWKSIDKKDKIHFIQKQNPEFLPILHYFKDKLSELKSRIFPLMKFLKTVDAGVAQPYVKYVTLKCQLLLHYCMNASFYMTLHSHTSTSIGHPVVKRLNDFKTLLDRFKTADDALNPGIDEILKNVEEQSTNIQALFSKLFNSEKAIENPSQSSSIASTTKAKSVTMKSQVKKKVHFETEAEKEVLADYMKMKQQQQKTSDSDDSERSDDENEAIHNKDGDELDENSKRTISYKIAKNKGLTPHRKKEYRNPRVRHRMKFKKAQIRRKGQVRLPRKELQKYGGEISGISSRVSKSIKIK